MKKFILILVIPLLFCTFLLSAQGQGQDSYAQLQSEMEELSSQYFAEKISFDEFQKQYTELNLRMQSVFRTMELNSPSFTDDQMSRIEELLEQSKELEARHNNQQINDEYYDTNNKVISQEMEFLTTPFANSVTAQKQLEDINQKIAERWPGSKAGWPPAFGKNSIGELCGLGPFFQGEGTLASYSYGIHSIFEPVSIYNIYQTGAGDNVFQDLKNQIEKAAGKP
ncbi:MAG: hypothetical protein FWF22_05970, partial [Treponema sp.]|nr:hypothetical protein [Treponema sp.]